MRGLRHTAHGRFEPLRFLYRIYGAFYWKQRLFHCGVFPNATVVFSGRCGGRMAVASGCATGKSPSAGAHEWRRKRSAPVFSARRWNCVWLLCRTAADWTRHNSRSCAECPSPPFHIAGSFQTNFCKSGRVGTFTVVNDPSTL